MAPLGSRPLRAPQPLSSYKQSLLPEEEEEEAGQGGKTPAKEKPLWAEGRPQSAQRLTEQPPRAAPLERDATSSPDSTGPCQDPTLRSLV